MIINTDKGIFLDIFFCISKYKEYPNISAKPTDGRYKYLSASEVGVIIIMLRRAEGANVIIIQKTVKEITKYFFIIEYRKTNAKQIKTMNAEIR